VFLRPYAYCNILESCFLPFFILIVHPPPLLFDLTPLSGAADKAKEAGTMFNNALDSINEMFELKQKYKDENGTDNTVQYRHPTMSSYHNNKTLFKQSSLSCFPHLLLLSLLCYDRSVSCSTSRVKQRTQTHTQSQVSQIPSQITPHPTSLPIKYPVKLHPCQPFVLY